MQKYQGAINVLKKALEELSLKERENTDTQAEISKLSTELADSMRELKFIKNDLLNKKTLLNDKTTKLETHEKCTKDLKTALKIKTKNYLRAIDEHKKQANFTPKVLELQKELQCKNAIIKELKLQRYVLNEGGLAEAKHVVRELTAKLAIANKQVKTIPKQ